MFPWLQGGVGGKGVSSKLHSLLLFLYLLASERASLIPLPSFHDQSHHQLLIGFYTLRK